MGAFPRGHGRRLPALIALCALMALSAGGWRSGAAAGSGAAAPERTGDEERAIVEYVDAHNGEAIELLERVVNINSGTLNLAGVREVGAIFRRELDALGFATRWEEGGPFRRAGHLIGERAGPGPRLLLIGHLDTVFEPDSPFQRFERLDGMRARGPGVIDMKGGDVILVQAVKALASAGLLDRMSLTVVMTGDEERSGEPLEAVRRTLIEAARTADYAVGFEDGDGKPDHAVIARRGSSSWTLTVTGTPAHSSQIFTPEFGDGAVFEAARVLNEFRERMAGERYLTFSPGVVLGGTTVDLEGSKSRGTAFGKGNVIAEHATAQGDLRTVSPEQLERAKRTMREIAARHLPRTASGIAFEDDYPPMAPSEGNRRLLRLYDRVSRDLGFGPVTATDPADAGAADVSFAAGLVTMAFDGIGLKGRGGHTVEETADLAMLPVQTKRAAVLLYRLAGAGGTR